jgi:hypothetical protein
MARLTLKQTRPSKSDRPNRTVQIGPSKSVRMEQIINICSDHLDIPSLMCLMCVSSECRRVVSDYMIWHHILIKSGFKRLAKSCTASTSIVDVLPSIQRRVQQSRACILCWKKRAPPIQLPNNTSSALCVSCEGNMLWTMRDIRQYIFTRPWRPKLRTLFAQLVIAKRRSTRQHLYWKCQVKHKIDQMIDVYKNGNS